MQQLEQALAELQATRDELLATIGRLSSAALDRKGAIGEWSVKNILAHLAAWEDWVVQALPQRMAAGETPAAFRERAENEDRFNQIEIAEREELTPEEQLMELERVREELLSYVRGLGQAELARRNPWAGWNGTLPEYLLGALRDHEAEHIAELRAANLRD